MLKPLEVHCVPDLTTGGILIVISLRAIIGFAGIVKHLAQFEFAAKDF